MTAKYDIVLNNGTVVDPVNGISDRLDVAVDNGRISAVEPEIDPGLGRESFDATGKHLLPGIIDLHVHASAWLGGRFAHRMMAEAGVTTALDMSGPVDSVLEVAARYGAGLNLACVQYVRPGETVSGVNPGRAELEDLLADVRARGAYGFKILGGHYPLTPEATGRAMDVCLENGAYLAFHAGSTASRSDIDGFAEAMEIIADRPIHLAHINSYCRGRVRGWQRETSEAVQALEASPNVCTEAYLSPFNGTSARCSGGRVESRVTVMCLETGGFAADEAGMAAAILAGWARINMEAGGRVVLGQGREAVDYWRAHGTDTTVSFAVNPEMPRLWLASAQRADGSFVVDCLSTDGGGIPRNVIVPLGLALVKLGALSLEGFVLKTSRNPAAILGLSCKGHLAPGADGDISVLDLETDRPWLSVVSGKVVLDRGEVRGRGGTFITSPAGKAAVLAAGLEPLVIDPELTPLCRRAV